MTGLTRSPTRLLVGLPAEVQFDASETKGMPRIPPCTVVDVFEGAWEGPSKYFFVVGLKQPVELPRRRGRLRGRKAAERLDMLVVQPFHGSPEDLAFHVRVYRLKNHEALGRGYLDDSTDLVGLGVGVLRRKAERE